MYLHADQYILAGTQRQIKTKQMQFAAHESGTKKLHEHTCHSSRKNIPTIKATVCIKRCLEIISIIGILIEVSHMYRKGYFLV